MTGVHAPGKLLLMGEHAVLYGAPCIVTAIDKYLKVSVEKISGTTIEIAAPEVKNTKFVDATIALVQKKWNSPFAGLRLTTKSDFSDQYGLGSSAAVVVATTQALADFIHKPISQKELFDVAYEVVLSVQKKGSGFDVAASVYGGTIYFQNGGSRIEPLVLKTPLPLIVGYTGHKASTMSLVDTVSHKHDMYPQKVDRIMTAIGGLVDQAKEPLVEGDWEAFGKFMNFNQEYLRDLGVSSEPLEKLIAAAKHAGAYGAKLSGAGGGDCMIALHPDDAQGKRAIIQAIQQTGGEVVDVAPDARGVGKTTTDNEEELFIVVDANDTVLGYRTRYDCHHDKSLIHRAVYAILVDDKNRVLLQKRSQTKDTFPGFWTVSCSGHVSKGQTYEQAMHRELREELGVDAAVKFQTTFLYADDNETEMDALFFGTIAGPLVPSKEEIDEVRFFEKNELAHKVSSGEIKLTTGAKVALTKAGWL